MPISPETLKQLRADQVYTLDLSQQNLNDGDAEALADALIGNTQLRECSLSNNFISNVGFIRLMNVFRNHPSLSKIDIAYNDADSGYCGLNRLSLNKNIGYINHTPVGQNAYFTLSACEDNKEAVSYFIKRLDENPEALIREDFEALKERLPLLVTYYKIEKRMELPEIAVELLRLRNAAASQGKVLPLPGDIQDILNHGRSLSQRTPDSRAM